MRHLWFLALAAPAPAWACGGLFCDTSFPVDQAAEQIVFGIDDVTGTVEVHVQVAYEGASEDFAWIVPVPAEPELFLSSDALFSTLSQATDPVFQLSRDQRGACNFNPCFLCRNEFQMSGAVDVDELGVTVLAASKVGPYETVTLEAANADLLVSWLQEAGYDLPEGLSDVLAPYVADGSAFVALKLATGRDIGDLQPLGMRYAGNAGSIPIQLTAVAALPDMPLEVFVLGETRAVPDNYLHVTLNDAAIDWWSNASNYPEILSIAADEAGGHAFVTEWSGSTDLFGQIWDESLRNAVPELRLAPTPVEWIAGTQAYGYPQSGELMAIYESLAPMPGELVAQGVPPAAFYGNIQGYSDYVDATGFSADVATDRLLTEVIPGLEVAQALLDRHPHATRMTSTMDAEEMTVDPMFVLNRDVPQEVANTRTATETRHCGMVEGDNSERTLDLADGRRIRLPTVNYLERTGLTDYEAIEELTRPAAILVEDLGAEGPGEVVFDWREQAAEDARRFDRPGCGGCSTGNSPAGWLVSIGVLLAARRARKP